MLSLYSHVLQPIQGVPTSAGTLQPALHDYSAVIKVEPDHVEAIFHRCSLGLGGFPCQMTAFKTHGRP